MANEKDIRASNEAEALLGSEVFNKAVMQLKEEYTNRWINSDIEKDKNLREAIHQAIKILPEVERHLRIIIEKGKITKSQIYKLGGISRVT
tara:strand:- start:11 stop:283 length:273 start_codon:yes stop_codon:yes gene_type:complete